MATNLSKLAFNLFGERLRKTPEKYANLSKQLQYAQMPISYDMYMSSVMFYSLIVGIISAIVGIILAYVFVALVGLPEQMTAIKVDPSMAWLFDFKEIFVGLFIVAITIAGMGGLTYGLMKSQPSMKAGSRKGSIKKVLPYAVTFLYALTRGGMNVIESFKAMAQSEDTYGEVSREFAAIINDMEFLGADLRLAIQNAGERTPSPLFEELMHGLLTVIDSGGNITSYFAEKSEEYLDFAITDQKGFLETLALLAESYVTAFVAFPLFIIIIQVVMLVMGGAEMMAIYAIVYMMIPIGSVAFLFAIYIMTPGGVGGAAILELEGMPFKIDDDIEVPEDGDDKEKFEELKNATKSMKIKAMIKNPLKPIWDKPLRVLAISGPAALIFFMAMWTGNASKFADPENIIPVMDNYAVLSAFMLIAPLAFFHEAKSRKEKKIRNAIPDFLRRLALTNEIGMTLPQSIELMANSESGALNKQIKMIRNDMKWGLSSGTAFARFANRVKIPQVSRTIRLLVEAIKSSGDVTDVLNITAKDARTVRTIEKDRSINMLIYVVIIYMAFMVFCVVVLILASSFLPVMSEASESMAASGESTGMLEDFDAEMFLQIFFHAAVIQGLCAGLLAGQMGEGNVLAGVKHSLIMGIIGYFIFTVMV